MQAFSYHRSIAPTLSVLLGLAIVETMVLHIIAVAIWGWTVALVLGALDLSLVAALLNLWRDIRLYSVTIDDDVLTMRVGKFKVISIPLRQISGLRTSWDAAALKQKGVSNLALATWPNVLIDLTSPVRVRGHEVHAIAHKLDDPASFKAALGGA